MDLRLNTCFLASPTCELSSPRSPNNSEFPDSGITPLWFALTGFFLSHAWLVVFILTFIGFRADREIYS